MYVLKAERAWMAWLPGLTALTPTEVMEQVSSERSVLHTLGLQDDPEGATPF